MMRPNFVAKMASRQRPTRTTLFGDPVISGPRDLTRFSLPPVEKPCRGIAPISTHMSCLLLPVAPAKAGAQGLTRRVACPPVQARGKLWVPAFAGMTKEKGGYQALGSRQANLRLH